jgi:O-antigen/teichoic acid export membrane protein
MKTNNRDVIWNYLATFLKIASAVILFPFILNKLSPEIIGFWNIFITITSLAAILDFGFSSTFSRNVSYIFSGVKELKVKGYEEISNNNSEVDYSLLKVVIETMRWFYLRAAILLFIIFSLIGTYYIYILLENFSGNVTEVLISWGIVCLLSTYNLYTLYYDSLLVGKGLIKESKQITILGHTTYLLTAIILIQLEFGLIAIVSSQALSIRKPFKGK